MFGLASAFSPVFFFSQAVTVYVRYINSSRNF